VGAGLVLVLSYRVTPPGEEVEEHVRLETTPLNRGALRWWGRCPLGVDGVLCGRRAAKFYLPPGSRYFGCRHCHNLTYSSCQDSHKFDRLYRLVARNLGEDFATVKWIMGEIGKRR
jgi:hypothetical protein